MNVDEMQRKLSQKAEKEIEHRFENLYSLLCNEDWLRGAHKHVNTNKGRETAGVDGESMRTFNENLEVNLGKLREQLKAKTFEPIPGGFRMTAHTPSRNSGPYKLLNAYGKQLTTTIDFILPNLRHELVQCGSYWVSTRATVTPITEHECRIDFCAAWNCFRWVPFSKTLFRFFAHLFLNQDKRTMERQALGLRYKPPLMLLDDADTPAKWYYKLKAAHLAASQSGRPMDHPLKGPITLRWRS